MLGFEVSRVPKAKLRMPGGPRIRTTTMPALPSPGPLSSEAASAAAQHRFEVIRWHEEHGQVMRLTARPFGHSPDTVSRLAARLQGRPDARA